MYHQVQGYWKIQLVCLAILIVFVAVILLRNRADENAYGVNKISRGIVYIDRLGTAL